jgi:hypothetical protein
MSIAEKLQTIAENEQKVYDAGYNKGKAEGGGDNYYDEIWDSYLKNGTITNCDYIFAGIGWNDAIFNPPHRIAPKTAYRMFIATGITDISKADMNFSNCTNLNDFAAGSTALQKVGVIDISKASSGASWLFGNCKNLHTIEKIITVEARVYSSTFNGTTSLVNITFEGEIGRTINFQSSPLSVASMKSIISHLKNYNDTDKDLTYTLTFSCWEALEADSTSPDGTTWREYIENTLGWITT